MQDLPETAQVIADIIGRQPTLILASMCKHRKLYVPNSFRDDYWITRAIGEDLAKRLHREFRGISLDLARCHAIHIRERNALIRRQYREGQSILDIIREHRMSLRAVRYVLAGYDGRTKEVPRTVRGAENLTENEGESNQMPNRNLTGEAPGIGSSTPTPSGGQEAPLGKTSDSAKNAGLLCPARPTRKP
jgi:hypothetical protein